MHLYSAIRPKLKRRALLRGSLIAGAGMLLLIWAGAFWTLSTLEKWGAFVFFASAGLIALGLLPYRRLAKLQSTPHTITLFAEQTLLFAYHGKPFFSFPLDTITKCAYYEEPSLYGIQLWLQRDAQAQVALPFSDASWRAYHARTKKRYRCDLFFPYFSKNAYKRMQDLLPACCQRPDDRNKEDSDNQYCQA